MCIKFNAREREPYMEKKKVLVELTVLTGHWRDRDIERDIDRLMIPLRNVESGQTVIDEVEIKSVT